MSIVFSYFFSLVFHRSGGRVGDRGIGGSGDPGHDRAAKTPGLVSGVIFAPPFSCICLISPWRLCLFQGGLPDCLRCPHIVALSL